MSAIASVASAAVPVIAAVRKTSSTGSRAATRTVAPTPTAEEVRATRDAEYEDWRRREDYGHALDMERLRTTWARDDLERRTAAEAAEAERRTAAAAAAADRSRRYAMLQDSQRSELNSLTASQTAALSSATADTQNQINRLAASADADERARQAALRRNLSRTRALSGGRGIDANDGSSAAVQQAAIEDTVTERAEAGRLKTLDINRLRRNLTDSYRSNLLERNALLARQALARRSFS